MSEQFWQQGALLLPNNAIINSFGILLSSYNYFTYLLSRITSKTPPTPKYPATRKRIEKIPPAKLPTQRERRLSLSGVQEPSLTGKILPRYLISAPHTSPQKTSLLLTKLPPELREEIWKLVLGAQTLHILPSLVPNLTRAHQPRNRYFLSNGNPNHEKEITYRLDYEPCKWTPKDMEYHHAECGYTHSAYTIWVTRHGELYFNAPAAIVKAERDIEVGFLRWRGRRNRCLALLKTCRLIYTEAIHTLYTSNTFDFRSLTTLTQFPSTILPHRFTSIRSLNVRFAFRSGVEQVNDEHNWASACLCLKQMTGLRRLLLVLEDTRDVKGDKWILQPIMDHDVKVNGEFVVRVSWSENRWEKEMGARLPFKLIRDVPEGV
ncbi:hypothetical protein GQ43DRAFT_438610, partial [Delitschia confertaspora ATCC 74209]